jgi:biotin-dependent carboxylase-like uncharacterized protein
VHRAALEVVSPGSRSTFQDRGRPGYGALGVSPSGAADADAYRLANRLAGNPESAVAIEVVLGGLVVRALATIRLALAGAARPATVGTARAAFHAPFVMQAGDELRIGHGGRGVYTYVAVGGGFVAEPALGSASTDVLGGIGPAPLAAGDRLAIGSASDGAGPVDIAPVADLPDVVELTVQPGPRVDRFVADALDRLCRATYVVTPQSNRIALRLDGPTIARVDATELRSEGLVNGAVQVPPDGRPIVFGPDHPVTGGYPVLAVVTSRDLSRAAQAHPGAIVRFRRLRR